MKLEPVGIEVRFIAKVCMFITVASFIGLFFTSNWTEILTAMLGVIIGVVGSFKHTFVIFQVEDE